MATTADFQEMMQRVESAIVAQAQAVGDVSQAVSALNQRINQGDANIEQKFADSEKRVADALAASPLRCSRHEPQQG